MHPSTRTPLQIRHQHTKVSLFLTTCTLLSDTSSKRCNILQPCFPAAVPVLCLTQTSHKVEPVAAYNAHKSAKLCRSNLQQYMLLPLLSSHSPPPPALTLCSNDCNTCAPAAPVQSMHCTTVHRQALCSTRYQHSSQPKICSQRHCIHSCNMSAAATGLLHLAECTLPAQDIIPAAVPSCRRL
jgi:hypothetical protein